MITVSGNTLLVAIPAKDVHSNAQAMIQRISRIVPAYLQEFISEKIEMIDNTDQVVIMISDYHKTKEIFCGLIADYLQEWCIREGCNAFEEWFLIRLVEELSPESIDEDVLTLLKEKVQAHIKVAQAQFGGNLLFHKVSNVELANNCATDN